VIYKEDLERVFGKRTWDKVEDDKLVNVPIAEVVDIKTESTVTDEVTPTGTAT